MEDARKPYRRRNYFIEKGFQADFILKFCSLVVIGGLLTIGIVYLLASRATTVSIVDSRVVIRSAADFILPLLAQTVAVVIIFVGLAAILLSLFVSHRIAGPLYRFKKVLESLEDGDFSSTFRIRSPDQLRILADDLNRVVTKNRDQLAALKNAFRSLERRAEELSSAEASEEQRDRINELKAALQETKKKLHYFRTS